MKKSKSSSTGTGSRAAKTKRSGGPNNRPGGKRAPQTKQCTTSSTSSSKPRPKKAKAKPRKVVSGASAKKQLTTKGSGGGSNNRPACKQTKKKSQSTSSTSSSKPRPKKAKAKPGKVVSGPSAKKQLTTKRSRPDGKRAPQTKQKSQRTTSTSSSKPQPKAQAKQGKVVFCASANKQLDGLGLNKQHRQEVKSWHTRIVRREMSRIGANHAEIRYLAHAEGSNDDKPHITASLKRKDGKTITNCHGALTHLYYDEKRVPPVYTVH